MLVWRNPISHHFSPSFSLLKSRERERERPLTYRTFYSGSSLDDNPQEVQISVTWRYLILIPWCPFWTSLSPFGFWSSQVLNFLSLSLGGKTKKSGGARRETTLRRPVLVTPSVLSSFMSMYFRKLCVFFSCCLKGPQSCLEFVLSFLSSLSLPFFLFPSALFFRGSSPSRLTPPYFFHFSPVRGRKRRILREREGMNDCVKILGQMWCSFLTSSIPPPSHSLPPPFETWNKKLCSSCCPCRTSYFSLSSHFPAVCAFLKLAIRDLRFQCILIRWIWGWKKKKWETSTGRERERRLWYNGEARKESLVRRMHVMVSSNNDSIQEKEWDVHPAMLCVMTVKNPRRIWER